MGSRIENVIRTAVHAFATKSNGSLVNTNINHNLNVLRQLLSEICPAEDLGLSRNSGQPRFSLSLFPSRTAPVSYMEIFENQTVSIGVFILKDGASIPLHDHVCMHGVLKVLYGTLNVQSYSPVDLPAQTNSHSMQQSQYIKARRFPVSCISEKDSPAMLSPSDHNLHTIGTVGGSASFLDILAPPYDPDGTCGKIRDCYYYADVGEGGPCNSEIRLLKRTSCPSSFWCDSLAYCGPDIKHLHHEFH